MCSRRLQKCLHRRCRAQNWKIPPNPLRGVADEAKKRREKKFAWHFLGFPGHDLAKTLLQPLMQWSNGERRRKQAAIFWYTKSWGSPSSAGFERINRGIGEEGFLVSALMPLRSAKLPCSGTTTQVVKRIHFFFNRIHCSLWCLESCVCSATISGLLCRKGQTCKEI